MGTAILIAKKVASAIALSRLKAPAGHQRQAKDSEQHAFQAPAGACATECTSDLYWTASNPQTPLRKSYITAVAVYMIKQKITSQRWKQRLY